MQLDPRLIKHQFEKSFETYDENAIVQKITAEKLIKELSKIKSDFNSVLELGSGTGVLTKKLVKKMNFKSFCANDLTEKSENCVRKIIPDAKFYCGNALKIKPSKVDLIISNAMFQWFSNLEKITSHCKNILNTNGILAFSTFSDGNFKEITELTGLSLKYKTSDEIKNILAKDFELLYFEEFKYKLTFSNPLELLAHLKNTGVNSLASKHWTFKEVKDFCDNYKKRFSEITLTYSPIIVICKKDIKTPRR